MSDKKRLVHHGVICFRDPVTREHTHSVPFYLEVEEDEVNPETGLTAKEEAVCKDFARQMVNPLAEYIKECKRKGIKF